MDTRNHILQTALALFLQRGFRDVTMKEMVESSGLSKGAFYHYFDSKEKVFEEGVRAFFNAFQIENYDALSATSLQAFYRNWAERIGKPARLATIVGQDDFNFEVNHYYLIFDALRLLPDFKAEFSQQQDHELAAWIKIIQVAQRTGEIKSDISPQCLAKLFISTADGVILHLLIQKGLSKVQSEVLKLWDAIYALVKT
ncbi:TetR/AcrR family transcriptional regulator [Hymenobacter weizhouensis]|uniref:TetR/AcrR family transcriptional regulator n=1 Tax=Hymenobacter sp. YIM 151500-1 TaxID=2987689 RepID=UPI002226E51C|nr:TetR/AcrR family transcriptional regulator [Hymenobacter sp. YIM 151500-1]UYZ64827.1 TetR/AcrR family transcriptional regulator [Hymenobacter sp. YIM 151500-1]